jgi:glutathione peroxidase
MLKRQLVCCLENSVEQVFGLFAVIPAKAGIQTPLKLLDCGSRCYRLARNDVAIYVAEFGYRTLGINMLGRPFCIFLIAACAGLITGNSAAAAESLCPTVLDHKLATLQKEPVSLCQYSGNVLLVVNTASECGYTPQYEGLEKVYRRYRDKGFFILGFPANDFGGQEPGSNQEIAQFCKLNYGVTFPMFAKTSVVGAKANPVYRALAAQTGKPPRWNFHKYLLDRTGQPVAVFESAIEPEDPRITGAI